MDKVVLDFETFYSSTYSLSKMTTQEYIMGDEAEVMLLSYKRNNNPVAVIVSPTQADIVALGLDKCVVIAHNAGFDVGILSMYYGVKPALIVDTLGMARSLGFASVSGCSLDALSKTLAPVIPNMPVKGTAVKRMIGLRMKDLSKAELHDYAEYCKTDTEICALIAEHLMARVPAKEAIFQDIILRCATEPAIQIDKPVITQALDEVMTKREAMQERLAAVLDVPIDEAPRVIMSNAKFATALVELAKQNHYPTDGLVPMKISATTGKPTHAFAKTDVGMQDLLSHPVEDIALLAALRLGLKTTTEHTRLQRFLALADFPALSVPYNISGAHTHRLSGASGINLQNLPSGRVQGQSNAARRSLVAPPNHMLVSGDSKQIETRVLAYIVGDQQALDDFSSGRDPYITMAAQIFNTTYNELSAAYKSDDPEVAAAANLKRQIGKSARLGCGFQLGAAGFVNYCKVISRVEISEEESNEIVSKYRESNPKIVDFWAQCKLVLTLMEQGMKGYFGGMDGKLFYYDGADEVAGMRVPSIMMPDGMKLYYNNLRWEQSTKFDGLTMAYTAYRGRSAITNGIYGGKLTENLVQALAFAILKWQGILIHKRGFKIVTNTHDEFTTVVTESTAVEKEELLRQVMNSTPAWVIGLPLDSDVSHARSYADC